MSLLQRSSTLAPFRVRSFRFQWPADLATSWALEMEVVILGWYVLVETRSVVMLTIFGSLLYLGTLLAPIVGVMGDHIGQRRMLCLTRSAFASCALVLMTCSFLGVLTPTIVLGTTLIVGLLRPSEISLRAALLGSIIPPNQLVGAVGIQRTTQDSARIAGALSGTSLVALLGMGQAYVVVSLFYMTAIVLMVKAGGVFPWRSVSAGQESDLAAGGAPLHATPARRRAPFGALKDGFVYAWNTPALRAITLYAFLLNLTVFPLSNTLLPVVAKNIYQADQKTLGYMVAAFASGALAGSLLVSRFAYLIPAGRMMITFGLGWFAMMMVFAHMPVAALGIPVLMLAGLAQTLGLVPSTALLLRGVDDRFRGRVMGIRSLTVYGNLPGLLVSGPLIATFGYPAAATLYCTLGILVTAVIAFHWREALWRADAPANRRS